MSAPEAFRSVSRDKPCAICAKPDWCRRSSDGAHECHRISEPSINGLARIATTPKGFAVYRASEAPRPEDVVQPIARDRAGPPSTATDFTAVDRGFRSALTAERRVAVAAELGVSTGALEILGLGAATASDLKRLRASGKGWRASYPTIVSSFPECDATAATIGFCFRADDGRKGAPSGKVGGKRGLIIPASLPTRSDPVLLVEGPTDVAASETLGLAAVGRPSNSGGGELVAQLLARRTVLVVGENDQNPTGSWPGRVGAEKLAIYLANTWKRSVRWTLPPEGIKDVRAYLKRLVATGLDPDDEQACHTAGKRLLEKLVSSATEVEPPASASDNCKDEAGARDVLIRLCLAACDHLFHDNEHRAYALVRENSIARTLPVRSREYGLLLARRYYRATNSGLPSAAKTEAIATLEGLALFEGPQEEVFVRIGEHEGRVILDLCDAQWRVVSIGPTGWEILDKSPIRFRRSRGMLALPAPSRGGTIQDLRRFLNVSADRDFILICAFLLGCFNPFGPYLIMLINGEAGSAKSTLCRLLRALIDPNKAPLRDEPMNNRDLAITANNSWVIGLDNMPFINERLSNALCRLATGGGFATRELYTDSDEMIFDAKRPVMINGIGEVAERSDLIDRAVRITLPTIPDHERRTERAVWADFEAHRSMILGAFLDAVSAALRNRSQLKRFELPRMADIAEWVVAAEPACPWTPGAFVAALNVHRREADEFVIEASPLASAIRDYVDQHGGIEGTATALLDLFKSGRDEKTLKHPNWPKSAPAFGTRLREIAPNLRRLGIEVEFGRNGERRVIAIRKKTVPPDSLSSLSSLSPADQERGSEGCDATPRQPGCDSERPFSDSKLPSNDSDGAAPGGLKMV